MNKFNNLKDKDLPPICGNEIEINKSVNNGRETCTSLQRGKTPRKRFVMEKKSWVHVLNRWEENANFQ